MLFNPFSNKPSELPPPTGNLRWQKSWIREVDLYNPMEIHSILPSCPHICTGSGLKSPGPPCLLHLNLGHRVAAAAHAPYSRVAQVIMPYLQQLQQPLKKGTLDYKSMLSCAPVSALLATHYNAMISIGYNIEQYLLLILRGRQI